RFLRVHPEVPLRVARDRLEVLPGRAGEDAVEPLAHLNDLARLDLDVGGAAPGAAERLMQQEARVGERVATLLARRRVDQRAGAAPPPGGDPRPLGGDCAYQIGDRVPRLDVPARRMDDHPDRSLA